MGGKPPENYGVNTGVDSQNEKMSKFACMDFITACKVNLLYLKQIEFCIHGAGNVAQSWSDDFPANVTSYERDNKCYSNRR